MIDAYRTAAGRSGTRFEVSGSEFIGYVSLAETVEEAEAFVTEIEECHPDAIHNIPAYRVPTRSASSSVPGEGNVMLRERQNDDGKLSGSSGKPASNILVQQDVCNVAAVVMRHYGGTNLGVGGLARAYSWAVKEALNMAGVAEEISRERFTAIVEYDDSGSVRGLLENAGVEFEVAYEVDVSFEVRVPVEDGPEPRDCIRSATSGRANIE